VPHSDASEEQVLDSSAGDIYTFRRFQANTLQPNTLLFPATADLLA
jgi:hypothetical protein